MNPATQASACRESTRPLRIMMWTQSPKRTGPVSPGTTYRTPSGVESLATAYTEASRLRATARLSSAQGPTALKGAWFHRASVSLVSFIPWTRTRSFTLTFTLIPPCHRQEGPTA